MIFFDPTSIAWYCPIINSKVMSKVVKLFNAGRFLFYFMLENMAFVYCLNFWVKYKWRIALFGGKNIVKLIHVCLLLTASQKIQAPFFHFHQGRRSKMTIGNCAHWLIKAKYILVLLLHLFRPELPELGLLYPLSFVRLSLSPQTSILLPTNIIDFEIKHNQLTFHC